MKTQAKHTTRRSAQNMTRGKVAGSVFVPATAITAVVDAAKVLRPQLRAHVTVQTAAQISGESPWTWRARAYRGDVASCKPAGPKSRLLIPIDEVQRFLAAGLRPRTTQ